MAKRKKQSALQKQYSRARKNAKARYNRALSKGLALDFQFPKVPKRITQGSINRLNKINAEYISKHSYDLLAGIDYVEEIPTESEIIYENMSTEIAMLDEVLSLIGEYSDLGASRLVREWLEETSKEVGPDILARALQQDAKYNGTFEPFEFYDKNGDYLTEHLSYLESLINNISESVGYHSTYIRRLTEWLEEEI